MSKTQKILETNTAVKVLLNLLRISDETTYFHSLSVAEITEYLIELIPNVTWRDDDVENILIGALLHDVGKALVPFHVQSSSQSLDFNRKIVIQSHPSIGYEMVREIFPEIVEEIVLLHHEKADGTGYPYIPEVGIFDKDNIPDYVTIVSYADILDALITDKPYRKGMPLEDALKIIQKEIATNKLSYKFQAALIEYVKKHAITQNS